MSFSVKDNPTVHSRRKIWLKLKFSARGGVQQVWFMPSGDIEEAMKEYSIDYCAASFDELYSVLKKWSAVPET